MSDRLDKELGRHIRAVFDAYEEPFDAGQWQRLQRKRRVKVITLYLRRSGAAAAAIALLVAASMFLWNTSETENPPVAVQNQEQLPNEQQIPGDKTIVDETSVSGEKLASNSESTTTPFAAIQESGVAAEQQAEDLASNLEQPAMNIRNQPVTDNQEQPVAENKEQLAAGNQEQPAAGNQHQPAESNKRQPEVADQEQIVVAKNAVVLPVNDKAGERSSRFSLGFVTTSLMNYADGNTASDVHFGAGITSGWKINDRLSVHSGLILAQNSLSLNRSNSSVGASTYAYDRAASTVLSNMETNNIIRDVSSNSMDVSLLVVDIPLNMTYRIGIGSSNLLLTGGLSSFAYLDQEYSYHNTLQLYTNTSVDAPEPVIRDEKAFSHFDFARQLNIAVGTELPLGNGSVLILEPYLKYPLGTLTSEHIRFGSAGMNLRFSFGTQ